MKNKSHKHIINSVQIILNTNSSRAFKSLLYLNNECHLCLEPERISEISLIQIKITSQKSFTNYTKELKELFDQEWKEYFEKSCK